MRAYELRTSNIELVIELDSGLPEVMVDAQQLQEVFLNLIMDAEQAMVEAKRSGKLVIRSEKVEEGVRVVVSDEGPGIAEGDLGRLFEPFFTTRGDREGTGLGLSVCHGIVSDHGGKIHAQSEVGVGSTFIVELPAAVPNDTTAGRNSS